MGRERGIMGSGNEGTINTQTHRLAHSYNRHQLDPPESSISLLLTLLVARIRGTNIILPVKSLIKNLTQSSLN